MSAPTYESRRAFLAGGFQKQPKPAQGRRTVHPIRSPENEPPQRNSLPPVTPPLAVVTLNRAGYGFRPGDLAAFEALGTTDEERLFAWIEQQIDPAAIDDSDCDTRIAAQSYQTTSKTLEQLWADHIVADVPDWIDVLRPANETITLKFLRAMFSKRQLNEVLADFWHDHFSVYWDDYPRWATMMSYDRDVIRPNIFGNFRDMLEAVCKSPTMLYYLDNVYSDAEGPNENFARELLELHTLGSEHYFGGIDPTDVPGYPNPEGYVEADVFAVTKALTGWSVRFEWETSSTPIGLFEYKDNWHDTSEKTILGTTLPAGGSAETDGQAVITLLATHPGTAKFVSRKLCRRLVADFPPESLVEATAQIFLDNVDEPDQLKQVVRHILRSAEFRTTWAQKTKRPFDAAVSALRALDSDHTIAIRFLHNGDFSDHFWWLYHATGHAPFEWHPPNGYPDIGGVWQSSSSLVQRWRVLNWFTDSRNWDTNEWMIDLNAQTPLDDRSPNAITDYWINRIFGYELAPDARTTYINFMAQGRNPAWELPFSAPYDTDNHDEMVIWDRIRAMIGLMLMSPEFQMK